MFPLRSSSLPSITRQAQGCKQAGCWRRQERRSSPSFNEFLCRIETLIQVRATYTSTTRTHTYSHLHTYTYIFYRRTGLSMRFRSFDDKRSLLVSRQDQLVENQRHFGKLVTRRVRACYPPDNCQSVITHEPFGFRVYPLIPRVSEICFITRIHDSKRHI